jgi:hypothetical protein
MTAIQAIKFQVCVRHVGSRTNDSEVELVLLWWRRMGRLRDYDHDSS